MNSMHKKASKGLLCIEDNLNIFHYYILPCQMTFQKSFTHGTFPSWTRKKIDYNLKPIFA